jgi:hypothetical protein
VLRTTAVSPSLTARRVLQLFWKNGLPSSYRTKVEVRNGAGSMKRWRRRVGPLRIEIGSA